MPAEVQYNLAAPSSMPIPFRNQPPTRRVVNTNGAALAAQLTGNRDGAALAAQLTGGREAYAPMAAPVASASSTLPWRVPAAQRPMAGGRYQPAQPAQPAPPPTRAAPGPSDLWSSTASASGSGRPRTCGGHVAAARADEPLEFDDDQSSGGDGEGQVNLGDSETAELGSPACPTLGSRSHTLNLCKPCAFVLKGCQSGADCRFCHLCEVGEKKRRKKEKVSARRDLQKRAPAGSTRQSYSSPTTPTAGGSWRLGGFW